jgi:hypothetical protein
MSIGPADACAFPPLVGYAGRDLGGTWLLAALLGESHVRGEGVSAEVSVMWKLQTCTGPSGMSTPSSPQSTWAWGPGEQLEAAMDLRGLASQPVPNRRRSGGAPLGNCATSGSWRPPLATSVGRSRTRGVTYSPLLTHGAVRGGGEPIRTADLFVEKAESISQPTCARPGLSPW